MRTYLDKIRAYFGELREGAYWSQFNTLYVTLFYLFFSIVITYPLILRMNDYVTGSFVTDLPRTGIFSLWWVKKCLLEKHMFSLYIDKINYPVGAYLYPVDPLSGIYALLMSPLFTFPSDYNTIFILNIAGGALASYFLVYYLTKNRLSAFSGGTILGFCPIRFASYLDGVSEFVHLLWLPLYVLFLYKLFDEKEKSLDNILSCGILLFFTVFSSWYYGIFAMMLTASLFLYYFFFHRHRLGEKWDMFKKTFVAMAIGVLLIFPFALSQYLTLKLESSPEEGGVLMRGNIKRNYSFIRRNSPDVQEFFYTGRGESGNRFYPYHQTVSVGYLCIFLAALGLVTHFRNKTARFWAVLGILFFIITIGPTLTIGGQYYSLWALLSNKGIGPYMFLCKYFPGFKVSNHPYRFVLLVNMACAVLGGFGVSFLLKKIREESARKLLAILIGCLIFIEYCFLSPLPHPFPLAKIEKPLVYRMIGKDSEAYSIIDLPFDFIRDEKSNCRYQANQVYMYYMTIHNKSIPGGFALTYPANARDNSFLAYLLKKSHMKEFDPPPFVYSPKQKKHPEITPSDEALYGGIDQLRKQNFRYLILHKGLIPEKSFEELSAILNKYLGNPVRGDERWIYIL